ncbi:CASC3/Barentsz eIF4AIII binding-domain-containing protein [Cladorrhinum sp. PSN332]|nr:CASC3/Barentsz eIF4AIII binding-domain-containing protein [Cladorrhinum sp. PSN332]
MAAAGTAPRRKRAIGNRRRTADDENDEAIDAPELDDDSMTEGSVISDEHDPADDSDTSNIDEASPTIPSAKKALGNGTAKHGVRRQGGAVSRKSPVQKAVDPVVAEADAMLEQLSLADKDRHAEELEFDDIKSTASARDNAPVIVSSASYSVKQPRAPVQEQKRREHEEYRKARDADPAFVPNRGAFFLHDHRHSGPASNGFRPFNRGIRGRGRGAFGGQFTPMNSHLQTAADASMRWEHDMHQEVSEPHRPIRQIPEREGPPNGNGIIPFAPAPSTPINRAMSTEKTYGTTTVRVYIPSLMKEPKAFPGIVLKWYTKLPDHRPPLRRDKPVRISLPYHAPPVMPRYVFPAQDRSFVFIPRALRPNQQRARGKGPRSIIGSGGGFSRRTSIWGGSIYGSMYSPSIALSRRSSIAPDIGREFMLSPTGSAISRAPLPVDGSRPVVRLPPQPAPVQPLGPVPVPVVAETSINDLPPPQTHPLPQKPTFQENKPNNIPMHQPRPQKTVLVENIESPVRPANIPTPFQQAFHHQVPPHVPNGFAHDTHARHPSYHSQVSAATPLSQIPERAIHAAPFQPHTFAQPGYYGQPYPMQQQPGFYYPPPQPYGANMAPNASAPAFVPTGQQPPPPVNYAVSGQVDVANAQPAGQPQPPSQNLVTQEVNGTVYYFNAAELPAAVAGFPPGYPPPQPYPNGGMVGMVPAGPDAFFYPQPTPGMVYYPQ